MLDLPLDGVFLFRVLLTSKIIPDSLNEEKGDIGRNVDDIIISLK